MSERDIDALIQRIEAQLAVVNLLQAQRWWWRLLTFKREKALVEDTSRLLDELNALTGRTIEPPAPEPVRGLRGPLFFWWAQQATGVLQVYNVLTALYHGQLWFALFYLLMLWIVLQWNVPPYRQAKAGLWRKP